MPRHPDITLRKSKVDAKQNQEIADLKKDVKSLMETNELKYLDRYEDHNVSTGVSIIPLNNPTLWAGSNTTRHQQREGASFLTTSYRLRGLVYIDPNAASPDLNNRVRMMVVLTKDSTTPASLGEVLQTQGFETYHKIKPPHDYKVLYDRVFNLQGIIPSDISGGTRNATATEKFRIPFDIKLGKKHFGKVGCKAQWEENDGAIAPRQGALTLIMFSDSTVISHPVVQGASRLRFMDN